MPCRRTTGDKSRRRSRNKEADLGQRISQPGRWCLERSRLAREQIRDIDDGDDFQHCDRTL